MSVFKVVAGCVQKNKVACFRPEGCAATPRCAAAESDLALCSISTGPEAFSRHAVGADEERGERMMLIVDLALILSALAQLLTASAKVVNALRHRK